MPRWLPKCSRFFLWVLLLLLLSVFILVNLISGVFYSRSLSFWLFGFGVILIILKFLNKNSNLSRSPSPTGFLAEAILLMFLCLLFVFNNVSPRHRLCKIAEEAGLQLPSDYRLYYFSESLGFVGSEDVFNVTLSLDKKYILQFAQPFWPETDVLTMIVPDNEREGLPITVFRPDIASQIEAIELHAAEANADPNMIKKQIDQLFAEGGLLPTSCQVLFSENNSLLGRFLGRDFNSQHKHWASNNRSNNIELCLDVEKKTTATAYLKIVIY